MRQAATLFRSTIAAEIQPAPAALLDGLAAEADDVASALKAGQLLAA